MLVVMPDAEPAATRLMGRVLTALAGLTVVAAYAFFASVGTMSFRRLPWHHGQTASPGSGYYASLAEGFLRGQLSMATPADPRLAHLKNPYDANSYEETAERLWDASYYRGRYYLYFSPLPVLLFYIPFRLASGGYPPDSLAAAVFATWGFIAALLFFRAALRGRKLHVPLALWAGAIGLGNVIPFSLPSIRIYEVAVLCGMAMSASWAWALFRFLQQPSRRSAAWMGVWAALAIAARPDLVVLLIPTAAAAARPEGVRWSGRFGLPVVLPLAITAALLFGYNAARFGSPFESGQRYQISFAAPEDRSVIGVRNWQELIRFLNNAAHYLFWAPSLDSRFPFGQIRFSEPDPKTSWPGEPEQIGGIAAILPLALVGSGFAVVLALRRRPGDVPARAGSLVTGGGWLVLAALSSFWWVVARYSLDFWLLIAAGGAVACEAGLTQLEAWDVEVRPLKVAIAALAFYSIALGFVLGFEGREESFRKYNRQLYQYFGELLTASPK